MRPSSSWFATSLLTALVLVMGAQCGGSIECVDDGDCTGGADYCNAGGVCVDCIDDGDCDAGETCQDGSCGVDAGEGEGEGEPDSDAEIIQAYCEHAAACGQGQAADCIVQGTEAIGRARASGIALCNDIADAQLAAVVCMTGLTCPQLNEGLISGLCGAEIAAVEELAAQAGNICGGGEGEGEGEPEPEPFCEEAQLLSPPDADGPVLNSVAVFQDAALDSCDEGTFPLIVRVEVAEPTTPFEVRVSMNFQILQATPRVADEFSFDGFVCVPFIDTELAAVQAVDEAGRASEALCTPIR